MFPNVTKAVVALHEDCGLKNRGAAAGSLRNERKRIKKKINFKTK